MVKKNFRLRAKVSKYKNPLEGFYRKEVQKIFSKFLFLFQIFEEHKINSFYFNSPAYSINDSSESDPGQSVLKALAAPFFGMNSALSFRNSIFSS